MSYLVLARKFRPQTFASIAGQEHITRALVNAIVRGRVPHAFLFTGPRGVGKTTCARVLARSLNCTGREVPESAEGLDEAELCARVEPCGECTNCQEIAKSSSLAVWEIDGASNNSVDNVRELIESLRSLPPPGSQYKIYIIDEVHMLSVAAFNALLKSLEEPPPNTIFIFATTEPHKIPETVISRCQRHDFRRLSSAVIVDCLKDIAEQEGLSAEEGVFEFIARKVRGGMRDAQSMLDRLIAFSKEQVTLQEAQQVFGAVDRSFFFDTSEAVFAQDAQRALLLLDGVFAQSLDIRLFIGEFLEHWRNLMLCSVSGGARGGKAASDLESVIEATALEYERYRAQLESSSAFDLQRLFDVAEQVAERALRSTYPRFVLEAGLVRMATLPSLRPLPEIIEQIKAGGGAVTRGGGGGGGDFSKSAPQAGSQRVMTPAAPPVEMSSAPEPVAENDDGSEYEGVVDTFNPSWQGFLAHVKTRKEVMLEAFLRRVSPKTFVRKRLVIEASAFDLGSLREAPTQSTIRECLCSYSGDAEWTLEFVEHSQASSENGKKDSSRRSNGGTHLPGSVAALEVQAQKERRKQIESEAKSDEATRGVLATFSGSKIEGIKPLVPG